MKIGIFGGTFDPPHIGHVNVCKKFAQGFDFDKLFVIPVFVPPHKAKKSNTTAEQRLEMSKIAFSSASDNVVVSDVEIKRQGTSYTADTIKYFIESGYDEIFFLCGTDMLLTLDKWYKPEYIFENATIVYVRREDDDSITKEISEKCEDYIKRFNAKIVKLDVDAIDVSSTEIRNLVKNGGDLSNYLSKEIIDYVKEHNLYKEV